MAMINITKPITIFIEIGVSDNDLGGSEEDELTVLQNGQTTFS